MRTFIAFINDLTDDEFETIVDMVIRTVCLVLMIILVVAYVLHPELEGDPWWWIALAEIVIIGWVLDRKRKKRQRHE